MGILYSHIVFQPPSPPTYSDDAGVMSFKKSKHDTPESDDDQSVTPSTDATAPGSAEQQQYVQHPIIYLRTSRGNSIPAAYFHQPDSYYTILFSHGNGEDLGITASYILELSNTLKTSILCYDYSGYGLATGKSSEVNCYCDIIAAYSYLVHEKRVEPTRIILFGRSLGSGPTIELASKLGSDLGGVVLIAALTSCVRVVFNTMNTLKFDMFVNIDKVPKIQVPVFCVHGMMDEVVPFSHGLELSRKCQFPLEPLWIRGAGHNNLESTRFQSDVFSRYAVVLREFAKWKPPTVIHTNSKQYVNHKQHANSKQNLNHNNNNNNQGRKRESFNALAKAAGCFGVNVRDKHNHDNNIDESKRHTRRRLKQIQTQIQQHQQQQIHSHKVVNNKSLKNVQHSSIIEQQQQQHQQLKPVGKTSFSSSMNTHNNETRRKIAEAIQQQQKQQQVMWLNEELHDDDGGRGGGGGGGQTVQLVRRVSMPDSNNECSTHIILPSSKPLPAPKSTAKLMNKKSVTRRCQTAIAL